MPEGLLEYLIQVRGGAVAAAQVGAVRREFQGLAGAEVEAGAAGAGASAGIGKAGKAGALAAKGVGALAVVAGAVGLEAVKMSNKFNTEMLKIRTEGGATSKEFNKMKGAMLDLASSGKSLGAGPTSLAEALFHIESMGYRGAKAILAVKLAAEEAAISGANIQDTATSLGGASFINAKGTGDLKSTMATLNAIAGSGNMRFQDLNEALGTGLLGSAKNAGLSLQEVGAVLAVLTDSTYKASSAGAQLGTSLHFLTDPTSKAEKALGAIHLTGKNLALDLHKPQGLLVAFRDLRAHMKGMSQIDQMHVLNSIFPGGRGRVMLNAYQLQDRLGPKYNQIVGTKDMFSTHVTEQARNQATKLAMAHAKLQASMIKLGDVLTKYLTPALVWLEKAGSKVLDWFAKNIPTMVALTTTGFKQLIGAGKDVLNFFKTLPATLSGFFVGLGTSIGNVFIGVANGIIAALNFIVGAINGVISGYNAVAGSIPILGSSLTIGKLATVGNIGALGSPAATLPSAATSTPGVGTSTAGHQPGATATPGTGAVHTHAVMYNGPDLNIHIAGHHFARVTKRELQKAMMAGA